MSNLTQTQINRRKRVGAELTRTTSAIGLGSLAALGASKGRVKLAGGKLLPKLDKTKALASHDKIKDKLFTTGLVSSAIGGANGFNNANWQSAEARQRKKPVVKSAPSPFEDGFYGSETFAKGLGDWKTIDQRERTQGRSRKTMRRAGAAAGVGAGIAAIGLRGGGGPKAATAARIAGGHLTSQGKLGEKVKRIGRVGSFHLKDPDVAMVAGGAGLAGAATATAAGAKGHHTYQQHKINQRRRANFKKSSDNTSAFGIVHD